MENNHSDNKPVILAIIALIAIVTIGYAAFNQIGKSKENMAGADKSVSSPKISVEGNEYSFSPSTITLKKGETVELTFKNTGKYPHNFVVGDLDVKTKVIKTGETDTITITVDKAGKFTYLCTVPGHADKGMTGTLIVE